MKKKMFNNLFLFNKYYCFRLFVLNYFMIQILLRINKYEL